MTNELRRVASILALVLTCPAPALAIGHGRLIGKVVDPEGHPIAGVMVTTTCGDLPEFHDVETTNDRGIFMVDFPRLHVAYLHEFEKAGRVPLRVQETWTLEGSERHEFKMFPAEVVTSAAGPPASTSNAAISAFNAGVAAFKAKDYATAGTKFQEAATQDPKLRQAWEVLSQVRVEQKQYQEAADAAEKAVALGSREGPVLQARWEAYRKLGDEAKAAKAREDLEQFSRVTDEAKRIHNEAVALSKSGDEAGALAKFKDALSLDPGFEPALIGLAATALKLDRPKDAADAAETILKADPHNEQALRIRYNASLKMGDPATVVDALMGLAAVDTAVAREGLFKLASAAYNADDTVNAKKLLGKVLEIDPNHPQAHYLLGLILMREGAKPEARSHLERFLALAPNDPESATARDVLKYLQQH